MKRSDITSGLLVTETDRKVQTTQYKHFCSTAPDLKGQTTEHKHFVWLSCQGTLMSKCLRTYPCSKLWLNCGVLFCRDNPGFAPTPNFDTERSFCTWAKIWHWKIPQDPRRKPLNISTFIWVSCRVLFHQDSLGFAPARSVIHDFGEIEHLRVAWYAAIFTAESRHHRLFTVTLLFHFYFQISVL